ncbi:LpqB family beta-propeller domain-containing protein [Gulosibacter bifidus]|uniref:LpqB family beta-propeller domain-containing protein n=1 Tax=Gulosibacter bifidus TaxID=272239 RepID=A0ABW5RKB1_9MICO|nr:LpqB family beta-propeller domain-containing protein [Gulosibacter bifidus]
MTRIRRILATLATASLMVGLSACASIPTSGPIEEGRSQPDESNQGVRYFPSGPSAGATREEIVQGFLDAGTGTRDGFQAAREYLTPAAKEDWDPDARVLITNGQASMKSAGANGIEVSVPLRGQVDDHGLYSETLSTSNESLSFTLEQVDGQWRIAKAPPGVVLQQQPFNDLYAQQMLTYFDNDKRYTSPDLRWLPNGTKLPTRVVQELINGPAEWMRPGSAVVSAFPEGVKLRNDVVIADGVAVVDFSGELSSASATDLSLVRLQLEESLLTVPGISSVEIRVNGARIDVSLPNRDAVVTTADVSSMPLVQSGNDIGFLNNSAVSVPNGAEHVSEVVNELKPIRGALSASRQTLTLLNANGAHAMRFTDDEPVLIDARPGQIEPALDNWDWVWTQSTVETGLYVSHIGDGELREIPLPPQIDPAFISHQVSRDGTRLAVLYNDDEGVQLAVMPIIRDKGAPVELGAPLIVAMPGANDKASDLAWIDPNSVGMLVNKQDGSTSVRVYQVGGELTSMGTIPSAAQIAGANSLSGMRIVDRHGTVYAPRGSRWQASETSITFLYAQV